MSASRSRAVAPTTTASFSAKMKRPYSPWIRVISSSSVVVDVITPSSSNGVSGGRRPPATAIACPTACT